MRLSKDELKSLIKECLVEILTEPTVNESRQPARSARAPADYVDPGLQRKRAHLESIQVGQKQPERSKITQNEIKSITSDPILQSIFADTAARLTETPESSVKGRVTHEQAVMSAGDAASKAMLGSDPLDIFDSASKWADLAFSEPIRRN
jgi:hypothetical protein